MTPTGWPRSSTTSAGAPSSRPTATWTCSPAPMVGRGAPITSLDGVVEHGRVGEDTVHEVAFGHAADDLGQDDRRLVLDHRHLADAVLAQDGDGLAHRLVGMGVDEGRKRRVTRGQQVAHRRAGLVEEPVVGHPAIVVELGEVAATGVGDVDHDDGVGTAGRARRSAPRRRPFPPNRPSSSPSSRVTRRAVAKLSASETATTRSTTEGS